MLVRFKSDDTTGGAGFEASYVAIAPAPACDNEVAKHHTCASDSDCMHVDLVPRPKCDATSGRCSCSIAQRSAACSEASAQTLSCGANHQVCQSFAMDPLPKCNVAGTGRCTCAPVADEAPLVREGDSVLPTVVGSMVGLAALAAALFLWQRRSGHSTAGAAAAATGGSATVSGGAFGTERVSMPDILGTDTEAGATAAAPTSAPTAAKAAAATSGAFAWAQQLAGNIMRPRPSPTFKAVGRTLLTKTHVGMETRLLQPSEVFTSEHVNQLEAALPWPMQGFDWTLL